MASNYTLHRAQSVQRATQILRETLERRYAQDQVVEARLDDLDLEVTLLMSELKKEK